MASDSISPFDLLESQIDRVIVEWRAQLGRDPWTRLSDERLVDHLPQILSRVFRLAREGTREIDGDLQQLISRAHGYFRREDAIPLAAVAEEFELVKRACWKVLSSNGLEEAAVAAAISRLDLLIDDATGYTLRGYYGPELDSLRGRGLERRSATSPVDHVENRRHP
jgi:hypothetical protein